MLLISFPNRRRHSLEKGGKAEQRNKRKQDLPATLKKDRPPRWVKRWQDHPATPGLPARKKRLRVKKD